MNTNDYDIIIWTDGSGTVASKPCGYCAIIYLTKSTQFHIVHGCDSHGSNNFAELFALIKGLYEIKANYSFDKPKVLVISDSEWVIKTAKGQYQNYENHPLNIFWVGLEGVQTSWGWQIEFKHVNRNTNPYNTLCDEIAGMQRDVLKSDVVMELMKNRLKRITDLGIPNLHPII